MRNLLQKYSFLIWRSENCSARNVHAAIFIYQICVLHLIAWRELIAESKEQFVYEKCRAWLVFFIFFIFYITATTDKYDSFTLSKRKLSVTLSLMLELCALLRVNMQFSEKYRGD